MNDRRPIDPSWRPPSRTHHHHRLTPGHLGLGHPGIEASAEWEPTAIDALHRQIRRVTEEVLHDAPAIVAEDLKLESGDDWHTFTDDEEE